MSHHTELFRCSLELACSRKGSGQSHAARLIALLGTSEDPFDSCMNNVRDPATASSSMEAI